MGIVLDRVMETSTTTGSGAIVLAGAATGYRTFAASVDPSVKFYFCMAHQTAVEWIVAEGYLSGGSIVYDVNDITTSSSGGSTAGVPVNFSAGTKDVFVTIPAYEVLTKGRVMARASRLMGQ